MRYLIILAIAAALSSCSRDISQFNFQVDPDSARCPDSTCHQKYLVTTWWQDAQELTVLNCVYVYNCQPPCDSTGCDDQDACTVDSCVDGDCTYTPVNCNDSVPCTDDLCLEGECVHQPVNCADNDPCTKDSCYNTESPQPECSNIDTCNTLCDFDTIDDPNFFEDGCKVIVCVNGDVYNTVRACNDGDACTNDVCISYPEPPLWYQCLNLPVICDDGTGINYCCINGVCHWGLDCDGLFDIFGRVVYDFESMPPGLYLKLQKGKMQKLIKL